MTENNYDRSKARVARYAAFWADPVVHPAADLLPMMSDDELKDLAADIKANGLMTQLVLWEDNSKQTDLDGDDDYPLYLLDGRNRLAALKLLGITDPSKAKRHRLLEGNINSGWRTVSARQMTSYVTRGFDISKAKSTPGVDPVMFVLSANVKRRHLTLDQKLDVIAKVLKANPKLSNRRVAKETGVSHPTVAKERSKLEETGDVEKVSTRTDTKGRQQPAKKPTRPRQPTKPKPDVPQPQADPVDLDAEPESKPKGPVIPKLTKARRSYLLKELDRMRVYLAGDALATETDFSTWFGLITEVGVIVAESEVKR